MNFQELIAESERFYNKELNPKFWTNKSFDKSVRQKLLQIAEDVYEDLNIDVEIADIQLTGSLANYNYNENSDLDVHILLDFSQINDDKKLVKDALDGKRYVWNVKHDIKIRDHEVEIYYQDVTEPHVASGLYSLLNDTWIEEPSYNPPTVDEKDVDLKAESIRKDIERLANDINDPNVSDDEARMIHERGKKIQEKISKMRKEGLAESGEFSVENLVFKQLRNDGSIEKLFDSINNAYDEMFNEEKNEI